MRQIDCVINFFMAYQQPPYKGGMWVTSRAAIAKNYLRTWFFIDFFSVLPFDILTRVGSSLTSSENFSNEKHRNSANLRKLSV